MSDRLTTAAELDALPVGSVVECTWFTHEDPVPLWEPRTKPVSRLFMVTAHMLIAERYEVPKTGLYGALDHFPGGIRVVTRPDASPDTERIARAKAEALREAALLAEGQEGYDPEEGLAAYIGSELRHLADAIAAEIGDGR